MSIKTMINETEKLNPMTDRAAASVDYMASLVSSQEEKIFQYDGDMTSIRGQQLHTTLIMLSAGAA
jgi:hypothetical protein